MSEPREPRVELRFVDRHDPAYAGERVLRYELLRRPLGFGPGSEEFEHEDDCLHLIAEETGTGRVVGVVMLHPDPATPGSARLLQMGVDEALQGRGLGARMVRALEERAAGEGLSEITLHARGHVLGFYEKLGYAVYGEPFEEVSIPHRHMRRQLV